jgi:hypothetical protein
MKHLSFWRNIFVMAAALLSLTSCSSNDNEQEKSSTTAPVKQTKFFACEAGGETRVATAVIDTLFTEDDIEWFNVSTREIRFKKQDEQLFNKLMKNYHKEGLEFRLGESLLFEVSRFVSDFDSRVFTDLVLHYSMLGEDEGNPRYCLHDCYPPQFIDDERTQANIKKNAVQWETFTKYLESKGKLR